VARQMPSGESEWTARDRVVVVLIAVALLGLGLLMTVGGVAVKMTAADKAERLRTNGVVATATLADFQDRNKANQTNVELRYVHEGRQYHQRIICPQREACLPNVHPTMGIRIDPAQPAEFVAESPYSSSSSSARASQVAKRSMAVSNSGWASTKFFSWSPTHSRVTDSSPRRSTSSSMPRSVKYMSG